MRALLQLNKIILDISIGHLDKTNVPSDATVIPPVCIDRWHCFAETFVVYFDDQKVIFVFNEFGYFEIKGCEAAFMTTELLPVQVNIGNVIRRSKINEQASILFLLVVERFLVPD